MEALLSHEITRPFKVQRYWEPGPASPILMTITAWMVFSQKMSQVTLNLKDIYCICYIEDEGKTSLLSKFTCLKTAEQYLQKFFVFLFWGVPLKPVRLYSLTDTFTRHTTAQAFLKDVQCAVPRSALAHNSYFVTLLCYCNGFIDTVTKNTLLTVASVPWKS